MNQGASSITSNQQLPLVALECYTEFFNGGVPDPFPTIKKRSMATQNYFQGAVMSYAQ